MTKEKIAGLLDELATLMELRGDNPFKVRAYQSGAGALEQTDRDIAEAIQSNSLETIDGVGKSLAEAIKTIYQTGELPALTELRKQFGPEVVRMLKIPGLGPKKVKVLMESGIKTLDQLQGACECGVVANLKGFGVKTQSKILEGLKLIHEVGQRVRIDQAFPLGMGLLKRIRAMPGVIRAELCGSLQRRRETVKDIDILASSTNPAPIMEAFVKLPMVIQVTAHGETKSSVIVAHGEGSRRVVLNADLRVVPDEVFAFAQHYFTGSKEHNVAMRQRAISFGLKLNEYGLVGESQSIPCQTETELFAALGLAYIPPEMREGTGEIALAETKQMPRLIEVGDIRGVFHNHTTASDGTGTLAEMAAAAKALGLEYLGIADHSQSLTVAHGLSPDRVRQQQAEIDELNRQLDGIRLLKGIECDILKDGELDYDDELLGTFDYVVASVHSHFNQSQEEMTARIIRAIRHPRVTMLGHPTGRLLLRREGYKVDLDAVLKAAAESGTMIEINAQPDRLDLDWHYCKRAKNLGVLLVINPDAHTPETLGLYTYGVDVARRGWLTRQDVFNTRPLSEVLPRLANKKG